ncbi:MAG: N-acetylmuramoyl-L-alanine amidase [Patescibacteria group bacterium]|nr:N-acetylmuramoyl-L-alanine amidase [Patescibacteria group bacterium]
MPHFTKYAILEIILLIFFTVAKSELSSEISELSSDFDTRAPSSNNINQMSYKKSKNIFSKITAIIFVTAFFAPVFVFGAVPNNPDLPGIMTRSEWEADESVMTWETEYARVEKFIIHHTGSSKSEPPEADTDGSGEYKDVVKGIYDGHAVKRKWGDIGYNYLIDPNGNIYEGRFGGNGVIGAHARGSNTGSVGISVMGTYGYTYNNGEEEVTISHPLTQKIITALEKLIGWVTANNNMNLNKTSDFHGDNIDGVVGHRDVGATNCPGDNLHKKLDSIQNNAVAYANKYKNYAYQLGGDKAIYILADGYKIKYKSKGELPTAYKNRTIKPISRSQLKAYKYKTIITYPDGSLLKEFDELDVYYLENGKKRKMNINSGEFEKMGFEWGEINKVFSSDLDIYDNGKTIKYSPDNTLIKDATGNVYLAQNGKKRKFTSPQLFEHLNYKWKDIKENNETGFYLNGSDMVYRDGTLIANGNSAEMYLIKDKQRREITSEKLLAVLGYQKSKVLSITEDEINHFPVGKKMVYPDDTLISAENSPAIYLVKNGKKKTITSAVLFEELGYEWSDVISISEDEANNHPNNGNVLYPDGILIKSTDNPTVYLLESGKKRKITSGILFEKLGYKWSETISAHPDEMKEYSLGKILTYPDGTLIRRDGFPVVFKIENGQRKEFTSLTLFEATNSKWSDVIILSGEEFLAYPNGGVLKYPEGTLLKQAGVDQIYIVKNGTGEWIKTAEEFLEAGYKWLDIIEISSVEMSFYANSKNVNSNSNKDKQDDSSDETAEDNNDNSNDSENEQDGSSQETGTNSESDEENDNDISDDAGETGEPKMRVAIYSIEDDNEDVVITANGGYSVNYYNSDGTINKTENKLTGEQTTVSYFNSGSYLKFTPLSNNVIMQILSYSDEHSPAWDRNIEDEFKGNDNRFRGDIEVRYSGKSNKLWVINELPLEDYVNGVSEAASGSPEEYLKAFSTIARTYAMYYIEKGGKHSGESFYLKNSRNGNGNDQLYKGYNLEMRTPEISLINKSTEGQIISYNDSLIVAAYSSDSGGVTKSGCEALSSYYCDNDNFGYLAGGVSDLDGTEHNLDIVALSHGAGMSAVGAYQMAVNGSTWQEIIKHYYLGVEVEKYY